MTSTKKIEVLSKTVLAMAVAGAFGSVYAQQAPTIEEAAAPTNGTTISVGAGHTTGSTRDRARFGLYNGLRDHDSNLLFGFDYRNNTDASWMNLSGRNLTLDNRELNFDYRRFGDIRVKADYTEITRHDPRTINTGQTGFGSTTPGVSLLATPGTGSDYNLETKRKGLGIGLSKWISPELSLEASFRNEEKDGSRLWGRGFACSFDWARVGACTQFAPATAAGNSAAAVLALAEPIDSVHRQAEAKLNYSSGKWNVSAGYYGSFYTNHNGTLTPSVTGTLGNQNGGLNAANPGLLTTLSTPMALWPDNQAHNFSLAGNFALAPKARINFKGAYTHATQNESFTGMGLTTGPNGRGDLGGVIDTYKGQLGFAWQPMEKLHLSGDVSYNEKKNKTPIDFYNNYYVCPSGTFAAGTRNCSVVPVAAAYTNGAMSPKKYEAKIQASYHLAHEYTLVGLLKYEKEDFGTWTPTDVAGGISALRQKLRETGYRVELRKVMSETFNGSVAYERDRRVGLSSWLQPNNFNLTGQTGVVETTDAVIYANGGGTSVGRAIIPFIYMDRTRDKMRLNGVWTPMERLEMQAFYDLGKDTYSGPTQHGLRSFRMNTVSLDASYTLSENWKLTGFGSRGKQTIDSGHSTGYDVLYTDTATSFGLGAKGTPAPRWLVGADTMWINDKLQYNQSLESAAIAGATNVALLAGGGLPDVTYRTMRVNLYGQYALQKNAYVRGDIIHYRSYFNEWTYGANGVPFLYSDNTTVDAQQRQVVTFIGASYVYKFQ